jgi:hypothetical protein
MLRSAMPTAMWFAAIALAFLGFAAGAFLCDRAARMFIAAFLSAGAWGSAAGLALTSGSVCSIKVTDG